MMKNKHQHTRAYRSIRLLTLPLAVAMLWTSTTLDAAKYAYKAEVRSTEILVINTPEDEPSELVKFDPETMEAPSFPGGTPELIKFLVATVKYPEKAIKKNVQGRVIIRFEVTTDGEIKNPHIVHSSSPLFENEAMRVIEAMPKWDPGYYKDNKAKVRTIFTLPIIFRMQ